MENYDHDKPRNSQKQRKITDYFSSNPSCTSRKVNAKSSLFSTKEDLHQFQRICKLIEQAALVLESHVSMDVIQEIAEFATGDVLVCAATGCSSKVITLWEDFEDDHHVEHESYALDRIRKECYCSSCKSYVEWCDDCKYFNTYFDEARDKCHKCHTPLWICGFLLGRKCKNRARIWRYECKKCNALTCLDCVWLCESGGHICSICFLCQYWGEDNCDQLDRNLFI